MRRKNEGKEKGNRRTSPRGKSNAKSIVIRFNWKQSSRNGAQKKRKERVEMERVE